MCIVLGNPVWYFVPGKRKVTEILTETRKNTEGMRNVFLAASRKLELDGMFLKSFFLAH